MFRDASSIARSLLVCVSDPRHGGRSSILAYASILLLAAYFFYGGEDDKMKTFYFVNMCCLLIFYFRFKTWLIIQDPQTSFFIPAPHYNELLSPLFTPYRNQSKLIAHPHESMHTHARMHAHTQIHMHTHYKYFRRKQCLQSRKHRNKDVMFPLFWLWI